MQTVPLEPVALNEEIDFILSTASEYLAKAPTRADVLSVFAGIRPLVRASKAIGTAELSRDHVIQIGSSGLVSIMGGKWTTYRRMAEDCVDQAAHLAHLPERACATERLRIHGFSTDAEQHGSLSVYGSDAVEIEKLIVSDPKLGEPLHPALPDVKAEVIFAVREEMARTVEDVLARRTRALFLNAKAALEMAPAVADLMAQELDWGETDKAAQIEAFRQVAANYLLRD